MSGQNWTPAPKKGIIPLHPLTFGMLLGKSFAALRHNPKVLFGFAVVIQLAVVIVIAVVMSLVLVTTWTRLESVSPSSPDFEAILAGTILANVLSALGLGLATISVTAMMQGVVAADIGYAAVGVKAGIRMLWRRMAPSFWRLAGFSALSMLFVFGVLAVIGGVIALFVAGGLGDSSAMVGVVVLVALLLLLASVPLWVWLSTKLLLVPSVLVLERARLRTALVRSWRLTRGRFWVAWGVTVLISVIMGLAMQVVGLPMSLLSSVFGGVVAPTGVPDDAAMVGFVFALLAPQILLLVLQAITLVVQSTAGTLVYLDCRMRYEGLDQDLVAHVERRHAGWPEEQLGDPYAVDPARAVSSAPPPPQVPEHAMMAVGHPGAAGAPYPAAPYPHAAQPPYPGPYPTPPYAAQAAAAQPYASQPYAAQPPYPPQPSPPAAPAAPPAPPTDSPWAAPGSDPA